MEAVPNSLERVPKPTAKPCRKTEKAKNERKGSGFSLLEIETVKKMETMFK